MGKIVSKKVREDLDAFIDSTPQFEYVDTSNVDETKIVIKKKDGLIEKMNSGSKTIISEDNRQLLRD